LFYHWYERKHNLNVIQGQNFIIDNPIREHGLVPGVRIRKKELHDLVRQRYIYESLNSYRFKGFSIYYEYYFDFFPEIEKFSLEEFMGIEFLKYLIDLFPHLQWVNHSNGGYKRYNPKFLPKPEYLFEQEFGHVIVEYIAGIPEFVPELKGELRWTYHWSSLVSKKEKEIENEIREERELPKIGEGWISETTLFYQLKTHYNLEEVIHHGNPQWLGLQHVDIWFPKYKVGVEYQGKQHDEPVEFFGGKESFVKNQERDKRKIELFKMNESTLIEVRPNYDIDEVIKEISKHIFN